jgi:hypothetical protein
MAKLKYINFENLGIIIFEEHVEHAILASKMGDKPISAGFVSLPDKDECGNKASCYGESVSLNIKSRPLEDTNLLQRRLNPYG